MKTCVWHVPWHHWHGIGCARHSNAAIYIRLSYDWAIQPHWICKLRLQNFDSLVGTCVWNLSSRQQHELSTLLFSFSMVWQWIFIHAVHDLTILNGSQIGRKSGQATCPGCFESLHTHINVALDLFGRQTKDNISIIYKSFWIFFLCFLGTHALLCSICSRSLKTSKGTSLTKYIHRRERGALTNAIIKYTENVTGIVSFWMMMMYTYWLFRIVNECCFPLDSKFGLDPPRWWMKNRRYVPALRRQTADANCSNKVEFMRLNGMVKHWVRWD